METAQRDLGRARRLYKSNNRVDGELAALTGLCNVYEERGDYADAIEAGEDALSIARDLHDRGAEAAVIQSLSAAYGEVGQHQRAIDLLQDVLRSDPDDAGSVLNLGWTLYLAGDYERSIVESKRALRLDSTQTYAMRNLGHAYLASGHPEEADAWYRRAIDERHEGEDFVITLQVLRKLQKRRPDLPRVKEFIELFRRIQADIERERKKS